MGKHMFLGLVALLLIAFIPPADAVNWTFTDNVHIMGNLTVDGTSPGGVPSLDNTTMDNTIIGGTTPAAGSFSSLTRGAVSDIEFSYLDGVTSAIQTQLNAKAPISSPTFSDNVHIVGNLTVDGTSPGGVSNLFELSDTSITSPQNSQVLSYSVAQGKWVNAAVGAGDMLQSEFAPDGYHVSAAAGGTGVDTSGSTGFPRLISGTWNVDTASAHRSALGVAIGSNVQAYSSNLATLTAPGNWKVGYTNGSGAWVSLGLGTSGQFLKATGPSSAPIWETPPGGGDVVGPSSSVIYEIPTFSDNTGKTIARTGVQIQDNTITLPQKDYGGFVKVWEAAANGTNFRKISAPDALSQDLDFRFPNGNPTANQFFLLGAATDNVSMMSYGTFDTGDFQVSGGTVSIKALGVDVGQINATGTPGSTNYLRGDGSWQVVSGADDVVGPSSATDNAVALFDGTTGKLVKNSPGTMGADNVLRGFAGVSTPHADNTAMIEIMNTGPPGTCDATRHGWTYYDNTAKTYQVCDSSAWRPIPTVVAVPSTATDACRTGVMAFDTSYAYFCVATDTWRRVGISSW